MPPAGEAWSLNHWTAREVVTNIFEGLLYARHCAQLGSDSLRPHGVYPPPPKLCPPAPLSIGFSRQEYCMGLSFPLPGDLPDPGIQSMSPASLVLAGWFFTTEMKHWAFWERSNDAQDWCHEGFFLCIAVCTFLPKKNLCYFKNKYK